MEIIPLDCRYREEVIRHILAEWGDPIVSMGKIVPIEDLPGFVAEHDGEMAGALIYQAEDKQCEIVVLFSQMQSRGVARSLIDAAVQFAKSADCQRIWLITTNDNTPAIRFYQRYGFTLAAAHINAFDITRSLKKEPLDETVLGIDDIPIRHELEFEMLL